MNSQNSYRTTITWGLIIRVALILFVSTYQNIYQQDTKITDIDYKVYSDAALYSSPYDRHTFRYSPIIAYINHWNYSIHESIGKIILAVIDAIAMHFLWKIVSQGITSSMTKKTAEYNANLILKLYSYNPLFIYLTVRGSIESITLALMYAFWYYFFTGQTNGNQSCYQIITNKISTQQPKRWISYIIFGLWVHLRVYPIIFVPFILFYEYESNNKNFKISFKRFIQMGLISGGVFVVLGGLFYSMYGFTFIQQAYLYHFGRLDNRHSFSAYFYQIYLNYNNQVGTASRSLIRVIPSLYIILTVSTKYLRGYSPIYLHFLLTYAFVSFNKVITFQYYMWILGALLIVLPESFIFASKRYRMCLGLLLQYIFPILIWIWLSTRLEGYGEDYLHTMWLVCLFQIFFQLWVLISFMKSIRCYNPIEEKKQKLQLSKRLLSGKQD